ncbi:MAG: helicase [Actinobacteria bacterium]|nr:helicase [Actinomycetota bacterium]
MQPVAVRAVAVRAELESLLERDLLGPWDGPEEELPAGSQPAERYLLGRLVPRTPDAGIADGPKKDEDPADTDFGAPELADREVSVDAEDTGDAADAEPEATVRFGSMAASSLGVSFMVPTGVDTVVVTASWGRYERGPSQTQETQTGRPATVWRRHPAGGVVEIPLHVEDTGQRVPDPAQDGVVVAYQVRHRTLGSGGRVRMAHVSLVNAQQPPPGTPDTHRLYQAGLTVTALDGAAAIFVGHNDPELSAPPPSHDGEGLRLAMLHRATRKYATGAQCAVDADVREGQTRAWRLRTSCFPAAEVAPVVPGDAAAMPGLVLDMTRLGNPELAADDLVAGLRPLVSGYRGWLAAQRDRSRSDPEIARYAPAADDALAEAEEVAGRLDRAVDLLRDDGLAREAFRFANQSMARQRVRSELVRALMQTPDRSPTELLREIDVPANRGWRPFQLAFVLLCLPGLTDPAHPDAHRGADDARVQLLFFPTGGGKTEAYLGLTAYTLAIRRLHGVVGTGADARDGSDGVAVLMRYTLRLLTAQQFQRAAALICACELLRRERIAGGDHRWGSTPFRLGLWVGSSVTPNNYDEAKRQVTEAFGRGSQTGGPLQLTSCPWCGTPLMAGRDLHTDDARRRVLLFCGDADGRCPFGRHGSPTEGLPVLTVDEEIYRLTPALVISTVDKLAQLPWKGGTAPLFGLVDTRCPRHGWQTPDTAGWCRGKHPATGTLPAVTAQPALRLRPPDLVIQDELHLISDALGSIVGLYESIIDRLASRSQGGRVVRPVLVASTATVRRAADQVQQVFDRGLTVFPPQVLDAGETFFSTRLTPSAGSPGRRYRGICAPGERTKSVTIRVFATLLEHGQFLLDRHGAAADPYLSLVAYFSSTRELAGTRRLVDDDIAERLASRVVRTRRRRPEVKELTSRMPSDQIATILAELERPFDPQYDGSAALDRWRQASAAEREKEREAVAGRSRPTDVLLATSMLQVGVDVPRLGLMVVSGQPKNTAEYIQATSRVGRGHGPGLVLTVYQWTRPRDLAHYESFGYDHATFGMTVEGVTTTPFSERALDRGLTAVLATARRHSSADMLPNAAAHQASVTGPEVDELVEALACRAERVTRDTGAADRVRQMARNRFDRWGQRRAALPTGRLGYVDDAGVTGLLRHPNAGAWDLWSAPMSLREVEPQVLLQLDGRDAAMENPPPWSYWDTGADSGAGADGDAGRADR